MAERTVLLDATRAVTAAHLTLTVAVVSAVQVGNPQKLNLDKSVVNHIGLFSPRSGCTNP